MSESKDRDTPSEEYQDEPVMDGATDEMDSSADPRKGQSDPALIRHPKRSRK